VADDLTAAPPVGRKSSRFALMILAGFYGIAFAQPIVLSTSDLGRHSKTAS
jgi:hypothetical protein